MYVLLIKPLKLLRRSLRTPLKEQESNVMEKESITKAKPLCSGIGVVLLLLFFLKSKPHC